MPYTSRLNEYEIMWLEEYLRDDLHQMYRSVNDWIECATLKRSTLPYAVFVINAIRMIDPIVLRSLNDYRKND